MSRLAVDVEGTRWSGSLHSCAVCAGRFCCTCGRLGWFVVGGTVTRRVVTGLVLGRLDSWRLAFGGTVTRGFVTWRISTWRLNPGGLNPRRNNTRRIVARRLHDRRSDNRIIARKRFGRMSTRRYNSRATERTVAKAEMST